MKTIITAVVILSFFLCLRDVFAADYRLYTGIGGMNVNEMGISEGHKSYYMLGGEISIEDVRSEIKLGLEGFFMGEPPEEDPEIPCAGGAAFIEYSLKVNEWIHPYLGIQYDHFSRGTAPKYDDPNDPEYTNYGQNDQLETEHDMVSALGGVHLQKSIFWMDLGTNIPFYTSTKSGNFGPDVGIGLKWKNFDIGYRFKEIRLTDHHLSGGVDLSFYFSGVELGWRF